MRVDDINLPQLAADAPEDMVRLVQALYDQWRDTNQRLWALETTLGIAPRKAATWASTATTFLTTPSSANLAGLLTDETGTGAAVFGTAPTINQANLVGTTTNNNAAAGSVGEVISSTIVSGSAVSLTTATPANITSISLTAGDWDVWFEAYFKVAATTTVTLLLGSISTTTATINQVSSAFGTLYYPGSVLGAAESSVPVGPMRQSLAGTTTIYAVGYAAFGVSTCDGYGILRARRVR